MRVAVAVCRVIRPGIVLLGLVVSGLGCGGEDGPVNPPVTELSLVSPNGGESLAATSVAAIRWDKGGSVGSVDLLVSTDGGATFQPIATAIADTITSYDWTVPASLSTACRVIVKASSGTLADTSAASFSIVAWTYSGVIQPIFLENCYTGCHSSETAERGLELTSWDTTIRGSFNGEVFIPFRADQSHIIDHLTGFAIPRMPLSRDPLPSWQIGTIRNWINAGAKNDAGEVPYAALTRKIYVANQGSDEVSVLSLDDFLVTRIVTVGSRPNLEGPHNIWLDKPGERWYVTLINANPGELWQYDAETDEFIGKVGVGDSPANGVTTSDGATVYVTNWDQRSDGLGTVQIVDAATMTVTGSIQVGGRPHGIAISDDDTRLYTTNYYTDDISVVDLTQDPPVEINRIPVAADVNPQFPQRYQPNEAIFSADGKYLFVALFQTTQNDIRVIDLQGDSLLTTVPTGGTGFLEELRPDGLELWVADWGSNTVTIVDTQTLTSTTIQNPYFSKPHGVAFSPDGAYAFVTNENRDGTAPQHHPTQTGGRNGNICVIDTATKQVVKVIELEPVSAGIAVAD